MNLVSPWKSPSKFLFRIAIKARRLQPKRKSKAFGAITDEWPRIEHIYVINLDRQPTRWAEMERELNHILDWSGSKLQNLTERYAAIDGKKYTKIPTMDLDVNPIYTLKEQLFVEPQPLTLPSKLELNSKIQMSLPEIAIAHSHINIWRKVAESNYKYALILEDDVWFRAGFVPHLDQAWKEIGIETNHKSNFDILYLSYKEIKYGTPKTAISSNLFRPFHGLWHLSGYVISREGAKNLLRLLPCRGPVDLWINHQFEVLNVLATRRSIISQRRDVCSTNSYSILPMLTKIGAISSESASLYHVRPNEEPVFAFGPENSGLSSLAMALSMLGYKCCSDLDEIPKNELKMLLEDRSDRIFTAYVNIKSLVENIQILKGCYPHAKYIFTTGNAGILNDNDRNILDSLNGTDLLILNIHTSNKWEVICEHLRCAPPTSLFPELDDLGQRQLLYKDNINFPVLKYITPKRDKSPWIVEPLQFWRGIDTARVQERSSNTTNLTRISDCFDSYEIGHWLLRDDTFTDNLALFRPNNIEFISGIGAQLIVKKESVGVREYSAAAITSHDRYLFGRFEATMKVSNVPGVVTGFFLHRDSPRQEIDIEISGNRTDRLLVNVFYNPGIEGARFDYGYRGAASHIDLGFDASESYHQYAIEWEQCEVRWFVDNRLVHRRVEWDPTPIPHLPMALHINAWPSRSIELAGRLADRRFPATTCIRSIVLEANRSRRLQSL